jgi:hypothetical protein
MFGLVFLAILGYLMYIEIVTFFENRRDMKRTQEYFKNRSWQVFFGRVESRYKETKMYRAGLIFFVFILPILNIVFCLGFLAGKFSQWKTGFATICLVNILMMLTRLVWLVG